MGSPREVWQEIWKRFDPYEAAPAPWRADRDASLVADILGELEHSPITPHVLLTGTTGTGKSTELLRVAEQRAAQGDEFVIYLDLDRHFNVSVGDVEALQNIASWEVCYLVGLALLRAAAERLGFTFPEDQRRQLAEAWTRLASETGTPQPGPLVDVAALSKSIVMLVSAAAAPAAPAAAAGLKLLEGVAGAVKWSMGLSKKAVTDQDPVAQNMLGCVNAMLATFKQWSRKVLVIIDGLDRVADIERAKKLFVESQMIARLECPLIVCGPFPLRNHMATALARYSSKLTLANAPVCNPKDPRRYGEEGIHFLSDLFRKRVADLHAEGWIEPADLERLAYFSGGRGRDFVGLIRTLAFEALKAGAERASGKLVDLALNKERLLFEKGLDRGHLDILRGVARDPQHLLPGAEAARVADLLKYGRLLPYANGSEWFYPHPLLTMRLIPIEDPGSAI